MINCVMPWTSLFLYGGPYRVKTCCWQNYHIDPEKWILLEDIWNSEETQKLRMNLITNDVNNICPPDCPFRISNLRDVNWLRKLVEKTKHEFANENIQLCLKEIMKNNIKIVSRPIYIEVHKRYRCNIRCVMCFQDPFFNRGIGYDNALEKMDTEGFLKSCIAINFSGGEPLLSAKDDIARVLNEYPHIKLNLSTNGLLLHEIDFQRYIERFNWINISLNAASKTTHERLNIGSNWEIVMNNLNKLVKIRNKSTSELLIRIHMVIMRSNFQEIEAFVQLARSLGIAVQVQNLGWEACPDSFLRAENPFSGRYKDEKYVKKLRVIIRNVQYKYKDVRCYGIESVLKRLDLDDSTAPFGFHPRRERQL